MGVDRKAQIQTISSEKFWEFPFKLVWHELCLRLQAPIKCSDVSHCKRYKNFLETYFEANVWGDFISHHHHGKLWVLPTSDQAINIYLWRSDHRQHNPHHLVIILIWRINWSHKTNILCRVGFYQVGAPLSGNRAPFTPTDFFSSICAVWWVRCLL